MMTEYVAFTALLALGGAAFAFLKNELNNQKKEIVGLQVENDKLRDEINFKDRIIGKLLNIVDKNSIVIRSLSEGRKIVQKPISDLIAEISTQINEIRVEIATHDKQKLNNDTR